MDLKKKAQGLSMNLIVVAAIAMIVLVVVIIIFVGRTGRFAKSTDQCPGQCVPASQSCSDLGEFSKEGYGYACPKDATSDTAQKCCIVVTTT